LLLERRERRRWVIGVGCKEDADNDRLAASVRIVTTRARVRTP
jgi:hypothetical protein